MYNNIFFNSSYIRESDTAQIVLLVSSFLFRRDMNESKTRQRLQPSWETECRYSQANNCSGGFGKSDTSDKKTKLQTIATFLHL
jgi:hypothetical protein